MGKWTEAAEGGEVEVFSALDAAALAKVLEGADEVRACEKTCGG